MLLNNGVITGFVSQMWTGRFHLILQSRLPGCAFLSCLPTKYVMSEFVKRQGMDRATLAGYCLRA